MAQVQLFKKVNKYTDKEGKEKIATRFYVKCGDTLVPVEIPYFEGDDGKDYQYNGRKAVLSAFAETLPDKDKSADKSVTDKNSGVRPKLTPFDDNDN